MRPERAGGGENDGLGGGPDSRLLIFNAGSSSLKFGVFDSRDAQRVLLRGAVREIGHARGSFECGESVENVGRISTVAEAAELILDRLSGEQGASRLPPDNIAATGHRVVHGGGYFFGPTLLDEHATQRLESLTHLAPLHNPHALAVLERTRRRFPDVPAIAEFDTSFFQDLPDFVRTYAIPSDWSRQFDIRRHGFHGIAHQYMYEQLRAGAAGASARVISLQLGQGCSAAAIADGRPIETSMGFTPLEGLVMGTRSGDVDPGVLFYMTRYGGCRWQDLEEALNKQSGLLGISGISDDIRKLLELESRQHAEAALALSVFCHRLVKYIGAYSAVLGGVDAIVFGGGIGENSAAIRERICSTLQWLGLQLDAEANERCIGQAGEISSATSAVVVRVVAVDEESVIAAAAQDVLGRRAGQA